MCFISTSRVKHTHYHRENMEPLMGFTEKAMAPHSSTLGWKIPWTEEPGGLQFMGSRRVRHNWVTSLSRFIFMLSEGNGNPLQCSCLENRRDVGAWWAAVYGVAQSRTRLKRLSSSRWVPSMREMWFGHIKKNKKTKNTVALHLVEMEKHSNNPG